mgnify:FL=1
MPVLNYKGSDKINILFPETFDISGVFVYQFRGSSYVHHVLKVTLGTIMMVCPIDAVDKLNWSIVATVAIHDHCPAIASAIPWYV